LGDVESGDFYGVGAGDWIGDGDLLDVVEVVGGGLDGAGVWICWVEGPGEVDVAVGVNDAKVKVVDEGGGDIWSGGDIVPGDGDFEFCLSWMDDDNTLVGATLGEF